ncbi:hypothetical protein EI94DRAFT_1799495 [Lactarius quietus]|nr:hypothetical protein EI94DRAFT_1799495 [Lactarius quietus]
MLNFRPTLTHLQPLQTYKLDLDEEERGMWSGTLAGALPELWDDLSTPTLIDNATRSLQAAIETACSTHMAHNKAPGAKPNHWWSQACTDAVQAVRDAINEADEDKHRDNQRILKKAVAKWRHGRKLNTIAALRAGEDGTLTFDHKHVAGILARRFFTTDPGAVPLIQPDDPPARPARPFPKITKKEALEHQEETSNNSTPESQVFPGES